MNLVFRHRTDPRTRRNRTEQRTAAFRSQIEDIVDAYTAWSAAMGEDGLNGECVEPPEGDVQGTCLVRVVDAFCM
jgi:hypothetical protein